jgi:catechol 2,3-dioxygenase-like lactoylglutathione lyase family enzyme
MGYCNLETLRPSSKAVQSINKTYKFQKMEKSSQPGINHIEFWVSDLSKSFNFYKNFLEVIGWSPLGNNAMATTSMEIYFKEFPELKLLTSLGTRHICFQATEKQLVDQVAVVLNKSAATILRGPIEMPYSKEYYTIDFKDPDGCIIEVAYTPYMSFSSDKN